MKIFKKVLPHLIATLLFVLVSYIYFMPNFNGKLHGEYDMFQSRAMQTEINKFEETDKLAPLWSNSIFFGIPTTSIRGKVSSNLICTYNYLTPFISAKYPFKILFLSLLGFYIFMLCLRVDYKLAIVGAIAYGFATFSISGIEASHYTKGLTMALMPAVIGGLVLIIRRKYFLGSVLLAFNFALQTYYYHYQISYYTGIMLLIVGVTYSVYAIREKEIGHLIKTILFSLVAVGLALLSNYEKLASTKAYAENTMRGGSDLAEAPGAESSNADESGLSSEYAFQWSYGISETFTGVVPRFVGGSSQEKLDKGSILSKELRSKGVPAENVKNFYEHAPTYFGDLPFTGSPVYFGALIVFLFVLGIMAVEGWLKWSMVFIAIVSAILAWGKNFGIINNFLFESLPYYNKFRTPMMAFSMAQVVIPALGILGLVKFLESDKSKHDKQEMLKLAGMITGGIVLVFGILFSFFYSYEGVNDGQFQGQQAFLVDILIEQRASLLRMDSLRSLLFIGLGFGVLWLYVNDKMKPALLILSLGALVLFDLGGVATRYLSWDDFNIREKNSKNIAQVQPTQADLQILQDKTHYRVYDMSRDPFNDNTGAIFHKMIGGYHPAKLSRFQDMIGRHLKTNNQAVLDMMNAKYLMGKAENSNQVVAQLRPTALGNAWFVKEIKYVAQPIEEIDALKGLNPKNLAVADREFESVLGNSVSYDSTDFIKLDRYHPDTMPYSYESKNGGLAVFSEMYYPDLWNAYIDGEKVEYGRVNYLLRAIKLKPGKHTITFIAEDEEVKSSQKIEVVSSGLILAGFPICLVFFFLKNRRKEDEE